MFDGFNINSTLVTVTINKQNLFDPVFSPLSYDSSDIVELDNSISPSNPRTIATVRIGNYNISLVDKTYSLVFTINGK